MSSPHSRNRHNQKIKIWKAKASLLRSKQKSSHQIKIKKFDIKGNLKILK